jgi:hypothetical protein
MATPNKRQFYRLTLQVPLAAKFRIIGFNNKQLLSNNGTTYIADISAGGIRMHSRLDLPLNESLLLEFDVELFHSKLKLLGCVLRKQLLQSGIYEYGVEFILDTPLREQLLSHIHMLSIRLKNKQVLASCSFCSEEEWKELYQLENEEHMGLSDMP